MKFGMKVGLWTLITGKLLQSCYLGNGGQGDEKRSKCSITAHFGIAFEYGKSWKGGKGGKKIHMYLFPWKKNVAIATKKSEFYGQFWLFGGRLEIDLDMTHKHFQSGGSEFFYVKSI